MNRGDVRTGLLGLGAVLLAAAAAAREPDVSLARLDELAGALAQLPPGFAVDPAREQVFLDLDRFFEAAVRPGQPFDLAQRPNPLWQWIDRRLLGTLAEAAAPPANPGGLTVWQMYNMGLLVRDAETVIGLDLISLPGTGPEFTRRTAGLVDALFITHEHPDHYDAALVQACLDAGKPVFLPAPLADARPPHPRLRAMDEFHETAAAGIHVTARRGIHVWAKARTDIHLVYYELAFPSGQALLFCGDLDYTREFEKTPDRALDLLVIPWRSPGARYEPGAAEQVAERKDAVQIAVDRVRPRHLLFSHYAELGHVHDGMEASYAIAAGLKRAVPAPSEWLFWGERLELAPPAP